MSISKIKFKAAMRFRSCGYQPPPKSYSKKDRMIWIAKMYELEQRESNR